MKAPRDLLAGVLLGLSSGFLALVVWGACQQAARTRAEMEAAVADAQARVRSGQPCATNRHLRTPPAHCVPGQVHSVLSRSQQEQADAPDVLSSTAP